MKLSTDSRDEELASTARWKDLQRHDAKEEEIGAITRAVHHSRQRQMNICMFRKRTVGSYYSQQTCVL